MASVRIVLRKKPNKENLYPVILRIVKDRKSKMIALGMNCKLQDWDDERNQFKRSHTNYLQRNRVLLKLKDKALQIIDEFRVDNLDFSLDDFEQKFRGKKTSSSNVYDFFDEIILELEKSGKIGNAKAYRETKNALKRFKKQNLKFKDVTPVFLEKFEVFLRARENKDGGIAFKMRQFRALYNKAINRDIIGQEYYPFKKYKVSKLDTQTKKRALTINELKKFKNFNVSENPLLAEAYHYFMFSFYTRGMNFVDMMKLKWSDIRNNRIYYIRSKTKGHFSIEIIDEVRTILDYYKYSYPNTDYVFPILLHNDLTPKQISNRKHKVLQRINQKLKKIAKIVGIDENLTTYVARHSFATILKKTGTSTDVISELMGHSDVQITMTYLKQFDNEVLDEANRKLSDL